MADSQLPDVETLRQLLDYDPETGILTWRRRPASLFKDGYRTAEGNANGWNANFAGKEAGCVAPTGYTLVCVNRKLLLAHRVIWAMNYGEWPLIVDHLDQNPQNNRLANLKNGTHADNRKNCKKFSHNTSGVMGVCWVTRGAKWRSYIKVNRKMIVLGESTDFNEAVSLRRTAEVKYGFSARHGR